MHRALPLVALALAACAPPVEAPAELGDLSLYLFTHFDTEGGAELAAGAESLETLLADVDVEGDKEGRSWTLPILTGPDLGTVTATPGAVPEEQVPVAVAGLSQAGLDTQYDLLLDPNQVCIAADGYKYYERRFADDTPCFRSGECDLLPTENAERYESLLAKVWILDMQDFRQVALEDGRTAIFKRGWIEQQFVADDGEDTWDQRYAMDVWLPRDDGSSTWRFLAFWSSAHIGGVGEDVYANLVADGIAEGFDNENAFVAGEACDNERESDYEPPF